MSRWREWLFGHLSFEALKETVKWGVGLIFASGMSAVILSFPASRLADVQLFFLVLLLVSYLASRKPSSPANRKASREAFAWPLALMALVPAVDKTATYKSKLWGEFRNDSTESLQITGADWKCSGDQVQLQPPFSYRLKVENAIGDWKKKSWRLEEKDAWVRPGWTFQIWIGINEAYKTDDLIQRHKELRIGTLIFHVKVPSGIKNLEIEL